MFLAGFVDERTRTYAFSRSTGSSGEKGRGLCITCIRLKGERVDCSLYGVEMLGTKGLRRGVAVFPVEFLIFVTLPLDKIASFE